MMRHLAALLALSVLTAPAAAQLIPADATPEKVADGYRFTEGPAAGPDGCIYFTDIPAELILKYDPETGETETYVTDSGQANGLMFNELGNLWACRHGGRDVALLDILATKAADDEAHWAGGYRIGSFGDKRLNSPNDLDLDSAGGIYFTDPRYGNRDSMVMEVEGVYYASRQRAEGQERLPAAPYQNRRIIRDLTRPNGIVLSPDESILYVADNGTNEIFAYDVAAPGEIENKRLFARLNDGEGGGPDGMCVDAQGRLYAAGQGRVWIYNPDGSPAGSIEVGRACTNCTFAHDGKTLYITANRGLYRIELNTDEPLPGEEAEDRTGWLNAAATVVEVSAALPWPISPNAATSIESDQATTPWRALRGTQSDIRRSLGGRRTKMSEIWTPADTVIVRIVLNEEVYAAFRAWATDKSESADLCLSDGAGGTHRLLGYAWEHGEDRMGLALRVFTPDDPKWRGLLELQDHARSVFLYFQVPVETEVTGVCLGDHALRLTESLEVDR